jgi:hypothetical protein
MHAWSTLLCMNRHLFLQAALCLGTPVCPCFVIMQELLAIQQSDGPKNLGFFGTRNMGMTHQKLVEILSYAMVSTVCSAGARVGVLETAERVVGAGSQVAVAQAGSCNRQHSRCTSATRLSMQAAWMELLCRQHHAHQVSWDSSAPAAVFV